MVRICNNNSYSASHNEKYEAHFNTFSFPLSDFQKHSIEAIVEGHHSLVCCPTGSGKTLPAEFSINFFTLRGKRVIYTSPLKALSNEKYYDFTRKYPHISIGLLTGDIKVNPEAQVLIMTAEILLNTLFMYKNRTTAVPLSFEMDFESDLGCVIMDEIHFINDESRGKVWEQTLMILPLHIQLVMLSATLDKPEKFAEWIEAKYVNAAVTDKKEVFLSTASTRIVPLTHYSFLAAPQALFKQIAKNEALCKEVKDMLGKPLQLQSAKGVFDEIQYHKIKKVLALLQEKNVYVKRQHVINEVCKYMVQNDMLPAVLFILSRKQIDTVSKEITVVLLEDDSKIPYIIHKECDDILRKLPNYEEYKHLPEYTQMVSLLEKGIGVHHSGIIPILREMVEILFSKGYIKLLLATETFSVGLNMPIKTTVFTSLSKFDGNENRFFYSHEYMQCSGRAGRRGIDKIGTVIHLNNLFKPITLPDYKLVMNGKPQTLVSKFKISYNLILHLIHAGHENLVDFVKNSMLTTIINTDMQSIQYNLTEKEVELGKINQILDVIKTPKSIFEKYVLLEESRKTAINKKRKEVDREISNILEEWETIKKDKTIFLKFQELEKEIRFLKEDLENTENFLNDSIHKILDFLEKENFISKKGPSKIDDDIFLNPETNEFQKNSNLVLLNSENKNITKIEKAEKMENEKQQNEKKTKNVLLNQPGFIAAQIKETHCLVFANIFPKLTTLSAKELIQIFSCFTNITVEDEYKTLSYTHLKNSQIIDILNHVKTEYEKYQDFEAASRVETGMDYIIHYDLIQFMDEWYSASSSQECKYVLQKVEAEKGVFLGEFVKAILKINTISAELENIAESLGYIEFLRTLKEIPQNTLKFVATSQSLYV